MKKVGEVLREYRQKQGIPLEKISQITHIRIGFLEAIEDNRFDVLPAEPFVKGFLHSYARVLGLDPKTILALLRRDFKAGEKGKVIPRQFIKPLVRKRSWIGPHLTVVISLSVIVLLILSYGGYLWVRLHQPPHLEVTTPSERELVGKNVIVSGKTSNDAIVFVDSKPVSISQDGQFETSVFYSDNGEYTITIRAEDRHKRETIVQRKVKVQE